MCRSRKNWINLYIRSKFLLMKRVCHNLLSGALMFSLFSCTQRTATPAISKDSLIKRGAYLVAIGGCNDRHSPKKIAFEYRYIVQKHPGQRYVELLQL
jgi:hypothetical protein